MRESLDDLSFFIGHLGPGFEASFLAARAGFLMAHIKLFFHDQLSYLLGDFSSCNLAIADAGKQVVPACINIVDKG